LPLYHAYPLLATLTLPFIMGASVTLSPVKEIARFAGEFRVSIVVAVPQMLEVINNGIKGRIPKTLLPVFRACRFLRRRLGINPGKLVFGKVHRALGGRVRLLASGGARLEPATMMDLEGIGFTVLEGYGLTETSPVAAFNPPGARKPGSVGPPVRSARIRISEEGEVLIKGPMVMKGYWHKPVETAEAIKEGYFYSGDLGYIDKDGYLFLTGRKKEVLVLASGKNVQPAQVEAHYMQSPFIKEIAVYEERGSLKALIVPDLEYARQTGVSNLRERFSWELKDLSIKLPPHMRLSGFDLVQGPLPKTSLGKIKRYSLGALVLEAKTRKEIKVLSSRELLEGEGKKVLLALRHASGNPALEVRMEDNLELDLGLDSIKRIELLSALEEYLKTSLPEDFLADVQDISGLLERLKNVPPGAGRQAAEAEAKMLRGPVHERALRNFFIFLIRFLVKTVFRAEAFFVAGKGFIPETLQGGFIIAPNHASFVDGFVLAGVLPGKILSRLYFQGLEKFFKWEGLARMMQVIRIDPERHLAGALHDSARVLEAGKILCIFPEGGRSYDGSLMEFKKGIAALALKTGLPVVPAWIEGSFKALPRGRWLIKPVKIKVYFGEPIYTEKFKEGAQFLSALRTEIVRLSEKAKGRH
jgi:long-chain acyl-CoA synthetase